MFGSKFKDFYFCTKLCILTNSGVLFLIWQEFFKITAQKYLDKALLVPNLKVFFDLHECFHFEKFEGSCFKYSIVLENCIPKLTAKSFSVPILKFFVLQKTLQFGKFEVTKLKYDNSFSNCS